MSDLGTVGLRPEPQGPLRLQPEPEPQAPAATPAAPQVVSLREAARQDLREQRQQAEQLRVESFRAALKTDPSKARRAAQLAGRLGLDPLTAERTFDDAKRMLALEDFERAQLRVRTPSLEQQMRDPLFARQASDDWRHLGAYERAAYGFESGKLIREKGMLGSRVWFGAATPGEIQRIAEIDARLKAMPPSEGFVGSAAEIAGQASESMVRAGAAGLAAAGVVAAAGQLGPQVAVPEEILTVPTAFTIGSLTVLGAEAAQVEGGLAYLDMIEKGATPGAARFAAAGVGAVNSALELIGVGFVAAPVKKALGAAVREGVNEALVQPTIGKAAGRVATGYVKAVAGETSTELAQEVTNIVAEGVTTGDWDGAGRRLAEIATKTAQGMALLAIPGSAMHAHYEAGRVRAAEENAARFEVMVQRAGNSQLRADNPAAFEAFADQAVKGTGAEKVYFDAQKFDEVLRQGPKPLHDDLEQVAPGLAEAVRREAARGGDVVMPTSVFASRLAHTEVGGLLMQHARFDPDDLSAAEAAEVRKQLPALEQSIEQQAELRETFARELRAIEQGLAEQLVGTGRLSRSEARTNARLWGTFVRVQAQRLGITPAAFTAQFPLTVQPGEAPSGPTLRQSSPEGVDADGRPREDAQPDAAGSAQAGAAVPPAGGAGGPAEAGGPPRWVARSDVRGAFASRTELVEDHTRELGADVVTTPAEAGQALAYLGRGAVERFDALVTDAEGRPLAIVGSFKGGVAHANVNPATIVSEAFRIQGAANIWFAHNHPSGSIVLSPEDRAMHQRLVEAFRGSKIQARGLFAIGGQAADDRRWVFEPSDTGSGDLTGAAGKPTKPTRISVVERVISKDGRLGVGDPMQGPVDAWNLARNVAGDESGALLLDNQHRPLAFVPIGQEAVLLRTGGRMDELYRAVSVSNAAAAVIVNNGTLEDESVHNLARFFTSVDVRALDVVDTSKAPTDAWSFRGKKLETRSSFQSGDRGFFDPKRWTITLTQSSDASTFLHEAAHAFLEIYTTLAQQRAHPSIVDDLHTFLVAAGEAEAIADSNEEAGAKKAAAVQAWAGKPLAERAQAHEAFAVLFEQHLLGGETSAPTVKLRRLFGKFSSWLRGVYAFLRDELNAAHRAEFGRDLPVLSPEIRSVMDRMLASEHDVAVTQAVRKAVATFQSQEEAQQAGLSPEQWEEHQARQQDVVDEATAQRTSADLRTAEWLSREKGKLLRELQQQAKQAREEMRAEVNAEVAARPVYRAQRWLRRGEWRDEDGTYKPAPAGQVHKIRTADAEALGLDVDGKGFTHREGLPADEVAAAFDFGTGEALLRALTAAPPLQEAVEAELDARLQADRPELLDQNALEARVDAILMPQAARRLALDELRAMSKSLAPDRVTDAAIREQARAAVAKRRVDDLSARSFAAAAKRAADEARKAWLAGDRNLAIEWKRRHVLQLAMANEAARVREEIADAVETIRGFFTRSDLDVAKGRDIDLVYAAQALATVYGLGPAIEGRQRVDLVNRGLMTVKADHPILWERLGRLLDTAKQADFAGGTLLAPVDSQAIGPMIGYRTLTVARFREVQQVAEATWQLAREERTLHYERGRADAQTASAEIAGQVASLPARPASTRPPTGRSVPALQRAVMRGWDALASTKIMEHTARALDAGKDDGPVQRILVRPMMRALERYREFKQRMVQRLATTVRAAEQRHGARWRNKLAVPGLMADGSAYTLDGVREVLGALLHAGAHGNLEASLVGRGWGEMVPDGDDVRLDTRRWDAAVRWLFREGILTEADTQFLTTWWKTFAELLPEAQKTHKARFGAEFPTVTHRPVLTPFGVLDGGYVPKRADRYAAPPRFLDRYRDDAMTAAAENFRYSVGATKGFTFERNPNYRPPLTLDVGRLIGNVDEELRFIFLELAANDVQKVLRSKLPDQVDATAPLAAPRRRLLDALNDYDRTLVNDTLMPWLENAVLQRTSLPSQGGFWQVIDAGARVLKSATSLLRLAGNLVNAMLQAGGVSNAANYVKGSHLRAAVRFVLLAPFRAVAVARGKSAAMTQRWDTQTRLLLEQAARSSQTTAGAAITKWRQAWAHWGFFPQRVFQMFADVTTWHGGYAQAIAEGASEEVAVERADAAVRLAQGGGNPENLAAFQVATPTVQAFLQFGNYSNLVLNQVLGAQSKGRAALWSLLLPAVLEAALYTLFRGDQDDDDEILDDLGGRFVDTSVRNVAGLVPFIGPQLVLALSQSDGKRVLESPAAATVKAAYRGIEAGVSALAGEETTEGDVRSLADAITLITGVPIAAPVRTVIPAQPR